MVGRVGRGEVAGADYSGPHTPLGRRQVFLTPTGDGVGGGLGGVRLRLYCMQVLQAQPTPAAAAGSTPTFITIMRAVDACVVLKKVKMCGNHAHALHLELLAVVVM